MRDDLYLDCPQKHPTSLVVLNFNFISYSYEYVESSDSFFRFNHPQLAQGKEWFKIFGLLLCASLLFHVLSRYILTTLVWFYDSLKQLVYIKSGILVLINERFGPKLVTPLIKAEFPVFSCFKLMRGLTEVISFSWFIVNINTSVSMDRVAKL